MSSEQGEEKARSWEILAGGRSPHVGALLRLGQRALPVGEVRGFVATTDLGDKKRPALAVMVAFALVGMLFLFGVLDIGMRGRFVVAAILFGSIALVALNDMTRLATSGVFRIDVLGANGETFRHVTADVEEHAALMAALGMIVGENSVAVHNAGLVQDVSYPSMRQYDPSLQTAPAAA